MPFTAPQFHVATSVAHSKSTEIPPWAIQKLTPYPRVLPAVSYYDSLAISRLVCQRLLRRNRTSTNFRIHTRTRRVGARCRYDCMHALRGTPCRPEPSTATASLAGLRIIGHQTPNELLERSVSNSRYTVMCIEKAIQKNIKFDFSFIYEHGAWHRSCAASINGPSEHVAVCSRGCMRVPNRDPYLNYFYLSICTVSFISFANSVQPWMRYNFSTSRPPLPHISAAWNYRRFTRQ